MNKIENVTALIVETADFTSPEHLGDMRYLKESVQQEAETADIVVYADFIVKNRFTALAQQEDGVMDIKNSLPLCRVASIKAKQATALLHALGLNMPKIDEEDMKELLLLASELTQESESNASFAEKLICSHQA